MEPAGGIDASDEVVGDPLATVLAEPGERRDLTANAVGGVVHAATNHSRPARVKGAEPDGMRREGPDSFRALAHRATA